MASPRHEFLALDDQDDDHDQEQDSTHSPIQPHLDTLFAEFSRTRARLITPPPIPNRGLRSTREEPPAAPAVDLRALDYVSDYDSHLMCPICHVPFVDPVVLDCDHTFCRLCYDEYREGSDPRTQCPTCRGYILGRPQRASRLIVNMCNDIKVRCPNEDCDDVHARGYIEQHAIKDCREYQLNCPGTNCDKQVKRRNYVEGQCIHSSHIECDCGAVIELGRGEWLKHKDEDCPATGVKCEGCGERISVKAYLAGQSGHICKSNTSSYCPGLKYGCTTEIPFSTPEELEFHAVCCPLARLAPHLEKQAKSIQALTEQLALTKVRNEVLETGLDRLSDIVNTRVLPTIPAEPEDVGIERVPSPTLSIQDLADDFSHDNFHHFHDLSLPAHLRPLTPNALQTDHHREYTRNDIHNLHAHLTNNSDYFSEQLRSMQTNLSALEARSSMMIMNETMRIKDELAQQSGAFFSTRAQVQWLLNRERDRMHMAQVQQQQQLRQQQQDGVQGSAAGSSGTVDRSARVSAGSEMMARTLSSHSSGMPPPALVPSQSGPSAPTTTNMPPPAPVARPLPITGPQQDRSTNNGEGPSTSARSSFSSTGGVPMMPSTFEPQSDERAAAGRAPKYGIPSANTSPMLRPSMRRLSGSQERVKL